MNTIVTATIEAAAATLTATERLQLGRAADLINRAPEQAQTLDEVEYYLQRVLDPARWFIYRGGNHIAVHSRTETFTPQADRVLFVTERRPEPTPEERVIRYTEAEAARQRNEAFAAAWAEDKRPTQTATVAPNAALQAMIDGTYDQKPGDEPAAREAAERRNRVMGYLAAFTDREGRAYASAYAHWCDEVGTEAAVAYAANRGKGLTGSRKATIRRAIIEARG